MRVGESARFRGRLAALKYAPGKLLYLLDPPAGLHRKLRRHHHARQFYESGNPAGGPLSNGFGLIRFAGFDQIFRDLPIVFDVGMWGNRESVLRIGKHTNLLSEHAWSPRGVGQVCDLPWGQAKGLSYGDHKS